VNVNILEAQKLVGVNINPAVFIRVGDQKKHTATQKSTNCPFYNENFQFEFQETPQILFDKVIEIKVFHRRTLAFLMTHIGTFKIDISTVYNQPDHRFYQKWAPLTDPADTRSGIKGYVKASLSVLMKGDALSMASLPAPSSSSASDDIEKNLLLPRGMVSERPWARFRVRIYRAEGLPTMEAGLMAKMSKATDRTVFIDPYVQVTFAGQQGETSVASATSSPVWNEEISFIEQFPPLAQRIRVQVLDDAKMGDIALATHFLDLQQISDPTRNGFNPTFGPCWVNLYGSPQNSTLGDVHQALNQGWGDGIFYRGRILLALSVEVYTSPAAIAPDKASAALGKVKGAFGKLGLRKKSKREKNKEVASSSGLVEESGDAGVEVPEAVTVEVEETHPLPEGFLGRTEEFLLFASLFEVTMMDPSICDCSCKTPAHRVRQKIRNLHHKISYSSTNPASTTEGMCNGGQPLPHWTLQDIPVYQSLLWQLSLPLCNCLLNGGFGHDPPPSEKQKPCLFVWSQFEDHSFRLYQANWLNKTADRLEIGLDGVERLLRRPRSNAKGRLVEVLLELVASCKQFSVFSDRRSQSRPNNLDRCRKDFIKKHLVLVARQAVRARRRVTRRTAKQRLMESRKLLRKLRLLAKEPQTTIPDAFLWLLSGSKRLAYVRIPAYSILFSLVEEQRGRDCGKVTTLYMKSPDGSASEIFAKLEVFMWLGLAKYSKEATNCLPEEFLPIYKEEDEEQRRLVPAGRMKLPVSLSCQALIVLLEGTREELEQDPPLITINIYDRDAMPEFKTVEQYYKKPHLRFFDISMGRAPAGELLAAFELIELDYSSFGEPCVPSSVDPQELTYLQEQRYYNIPEGVRPVLKTFRIEVLFWGLRDLKRVQLFEVERPLVRVECAGRQLDSEEIESYSTHPNFKELVRYIDVELPEQAYLHPPLTVFVVEHRAFGRMALVGTHVVQSLMDYAPRELGGEEEEEDDEPKPKVRQNTRKMDPLNAVTRMGLSNLSIKQSKIPLNPMKLVNAPLKKLMKKGEELEEETPEKEELDWWSKYYASVEEMEREAAKREEEEMEEHAENEAGNLTMANIEEEEEEDMVVVEIEPPKRKNIATLKLYGGDLESDFSQFQDWLQIFTLYKGRASIEGDEEDEEERLMGKYKGSFLVYPIDSGDEEDTKCQITNGIPKNSPIKVLVRVYIVKATTLAPTDPNGKADPYLVVRAGKQSLDTVDRYIPKQLNPTFGEVFELTVSFPLETELVVTVMDHDLIGADDMIGETRVDLENRFYSRHRPSCGLARYYDTDGYNVWRDAKRPSAVLAELCSKNGILSPEYRTSEVKVLNKIFKIPSDAIPEGLLKKNQRSPEEEAEIEEHAALSVLQRWGEMNEFLSGAVPLVPEHVEIRSLLSQDKPGLPQLRVIIWNTDDVFLDDVNPFTGIPSSDIYVKGSLTGEGNFNWRFVFRFDYLPTEASEFRQPAVLTLQVWDYDRIAANDFLELRLNDMVRAAKSSTKCTIAMAKDRASPRFSIFRAKKMKGWWPLIRQKTGKVEAELQLVTLEQAEANPVGRARKEPEPLDKPNRPSTSFTWFVNPMKTFVFLIWKKFKKFIIALVILAILTLFLGLIVYTLPQQIASIIIKG
ncbi:Fer-1-like protein 4, partial [Dissostichus eleginoides]